MTLIQAFEIGIWNAWIFIVPYILMNFALPFLVINRKSTFWAWRPYARLERTYPLAGMVFMGCMWIYSIFLPLSLSTAWFYVGLAFYLVGWAFLISAMLVFTTSPVDKPNTTGVYRISRHPWYIGFFIYGNRHSQCILDLHPGSLAITSYVQKCLYDTRRTYVLREVW